MYRNWNLTKDVIKRALYSGSFIIISALYVVINRYTGKEKEIITFVDNLIPFNQYFILPYVFWYVYMGAFLLYFCIFDEKKYYKLVIGLNIGMIIAYCIYIIFPTTVPRVHFTPNNGVIAWLFKWLYERDNPYNCLPSLHVLNTIFVAIFVQRDNLHLNKYIKMLSIIVAGVIIYSTFAIKQHVIWDAISGAVVAYGIYGALEYKEIYSKIKGFQRVSET